MSQCWRRILLKSDVGNARVMATYTGLPFLRGHRVVIASVPIGLRV